MKAVSQHQRDELARRKAMGIALIQRPLRYIAARTNTTEPDAKGFMRKVASRDFQIARLAADLGRGEVVQRIASRLLA